MSKQLTVLCVPVSETGHVNNAMGIAKALKERNHRIVFATEESWKGKFEVFGFEEEIYKENDGQTEANQIWVDQIVAVQSYFGHPPVEQMIKFSGMWDAIIEAAKRAEPGIRKIVDRVKPDVIIQNHHLSNPCLATAGVPYIWMCAENALDIPVNRRMAPPSGSGLPADDPSKWEAFFKEQDKFFGPKHEAFNKWVQSQGGPPLPPDSLHYISKNLNLYMCPAELDYVDIRPLDSTFFRVDGYVRFENEEFQLPEALKALPGKWVYLSLGSLGAGSVDLMKRLVSILSKSKHKFIVSKGPRHSEYDLAPNMWGATSLPQLQVINKMDLVITHGGNNSFTECLYFGKPMIVLPLFYDQHDNAQRLVDKKLGLHFNPVHVKEEELIAGIDHVLNDQVLIDKVKTIGENIRTRKSVERAAARIEEVARNPIIPTV